jgi:hypothetical protein
MSANNCFRNLKFSGIGRILPSIHKGFLQNSQTNDETTQEEQSFLVDSGVPSQF